MTESRPFYASSDRKLCRHGYPVRNDPEAQVCVDREILAQCRTTRERSRRHIDLLASLRLWRLAGWFQKRRNLRQFGD